MAALEEHGIDDNTLVIFTSDNGANYIGMPNINKPYRGWKLSFEGGTHVPYYAGPSIAARCDLTIRFRISMCCRRL